MRIFAFPTPHPMATRFVPVSHPARPASCISSGARTALFSWAFARRHGGKFILRVEDTDVARSTPEAVQAILDGMKWLELEDEGPFYQMQRMDRYKEVIGRCWPGRGLPLLHHARRVDALREGRARGEKPRWRRALAS